MSYMNAILDLLNADSVLVNGVDEIIASAPHKEMDLSKPRQTVICVSDQVVADDKFLSTYRDAQKSKITIKVECVSSFGNNDQYCSSIIDYIYDIFSNISSLTDTGWILHLNSSNVDVVPLDPAKWQGTLALTCDLFTDT
jgi:hypothetical protein